MRLDTTFRWTWDNAISHHGLAKTTVQALGHKYPRYSAIYEFFFGENQVYQVDLFGVIKNESKPASGVSLTPVNLLTGHTAFLPDIAKERITISALCARADKIMLGIHGRYDDTDKGFAGLGWEKGDGVIGDCKQFADLIASFLLSNKSYRLSLIVCFGARSANFRVNHDGKLDKEDIKSSFAYKFFREICTKADVIMTARTGSVSFDDKTGRSLVQTEAAVQADIELGEIRAAAEKERINSEFERILGKWGPQKFGEAVRKMQNPKEVPSNREEEVIRK